VLIIDPALKSRAGHHFNITNALIATAKDHGWEARVLVSIWAPADIKRELGATGCFHHTLYHRQDWSRFGFDRQSFAFAEILRHQIAKWKTLPNVVIFPCCDQVQYNGFAKAVRDLNLPWKPAVFAWQMFPPRVDLSLGDVRSLPQVEEYKTAYQNIKSILGAAGALSIATETSSLSDTYTQLSGVPVVILRSPSVLEGITASAAQSPDSLLHVVVTGHANAGKGYERLPAALADVVNKRPNIRFTVHGTISGTENRTTMMKTFEAIKDIGSRVETITHALDTEGYYKLLQSASLLLMPYDPVTYRTRGSGIFDESLNLGIPTIAPEGCEFAAAAIQDKRAVGITAHTPQAIRDAIVSAVDNYSQLAAATRAYASQWQEKKSPKEYVTAVLDTAEAGDWPGLRQNTWRRMWHGIRFVTACVVSLVP